MRSYFIKAHFFNILSFLITSIILNATILLHYQRRDHYDNSVCNHYYLSPNYGINQNKPLLAAVTAKEVNSLIFIRFNIL